MKPLPILLSLLVACSLTGCNAHKQTHAVSSQKISRTHDVDASQLLNAELTRLTVTDRDVILSGVRFNFNRPDSNATQKNPDLSPASITIDEIRVKEKTDASSAGRISSQAETSGKSVTNVDNKSESSEETHSEVFRPPDFLTIMAVILIIGLISFIIVKYRLFRKPPEN